MSVLRLTTMNFFDLLSIIKVYEKNWYGLREGDVIVKTNGN